MMSNWEASEIQMVFKMEHKIMFQTTNLERYGKRPKISAIQDVFRRAYVREAAWSTRQ